MDKVILDVLLSTCHSRSVENSDDEANLFLLGFGPAASGIEICLNTTCASVGSAQRSNQLTRFPALMICSA